MKGFTLRVWIVLNTGGEGEIRKGQAFRRCEVLGREEQPGRAAVEFILRLLEDSILPDDASSQAMNRKHGCRRVRRDENRRFCGTGSLYTKRCKK